MENGTSAGVLPQSVHMQRLMHLLHMKLQFCYLNVAVKFYLRSAMSKKAFSKLLQHGVLLMKLFSACFLWMCGLTQHPEVLLHVALISGNVHVPSGQEQSMQYTTSQVKKKKLAEALQTLLCHSSLWSTLSKTSLVVGACICSDLLEMKDRHYNCANYYESLYVSIVCLSSEQEKQ